MSDFAEVIDEILAEVQTAIADTVTLRRGYQNPDSIYVSDAEPVFCMVFNPEETQDTLPDAQFDRQVEYQLVLVRRPDLFDEMARDLDLVRDEIQKSWQPTTGPLAGLVDTASCSQRAVDEVIDAGKTYGLMTITTTEVT